MTSPGIRVDSTRRPCGAPMLSVIVPAHNARGELEQCLSALALSTYKIFEVMVVDDASRESRQALLPDDRFRYIRLEACRGPSRARNVGAASAVGDYLVFVDADVRVHRDTLSRFVAGFAKDPELGAIMGAYDDSPADPGFLSQYKNLFHRYIHQCSEGKINAFWSGCGAMRRDLFLEFRGFNAGQYREPSIEDLELGMRAEAAGVRIILDSRIQGQHLKRWTFWNLVKTDIFRRGIPWMRLILRRGGLPDTLNLKRNQMVSVVLAYVTGLSILASLRIPWLEIGAAISVAAVTVMNLDLYRFFMARRGAWFTIRALPMHWFYLFYCGVSAWAGLLLYLLDLFRSSEMKEAKKDQILVPDDSV